MAPLRYFDHLFDEEDMVHDTCWGLKHRGAPLFWGKKEFLNTKM